MDKCLGSAGPVEIREALPGDARAISELKGRVLRRNYTVFASPAEIEGEIRSGTDVNLLTDQINDPRIYFLVAYSDGRLVGVGAIRASGECFSARCDPLGRGTGSAILQQRLAWARGHEISRVWASVFVDNRLGRAYLERHQFRVVRGTRRPGRSMPGYTVEDMERFI